MRTFCFLLLVALMGCETNGTDAATLEAYRGHYPLDENGEYILDSLGFPGVHPRDADGNVIPEPVPDWTYVNQDRDTVTNKDLLGQTYVVDFFFMSCPTICPTVKGNMLRIHDKFGERDDFKLVSFTVDPKRDTPEAMKEYARKLGITNTDEWWYLYGDKLQTFELDAEYLSVAEENPNAPGGFDHSGYIVLVDKKGFVRAYASGIKDNEVDRLMRDIDLLLSKS